GTDDAHDDVVVEEQRDATGDDVAARIDRARLDQPMPVEAVVGGLEPTLPNRFEPMGPRRGHEVVEERASPDKPFDAEQLLGVERTIRGAMLRVSLARDAAMANVVHPTPPAWRESTQDARRSGCGARRGGRSGE